jgi:hypothetical protein
MNQYNENNIFTNKVETTYYYFDNEDHAQMFKLFAHSELLIIFHNFKITEDD